MNQDLFDFNSGQILKKSAPLADRMRPQTLDEFVGQSGILAEGRLLRRAIKADRLGSLLLHGPPGVGKTTLARVIAAHTRAHFSSLNAVLAGVKDLRLEVEEAKKRLELYGLRSILFIDEVHRFNTAQQDALLPWVENGIITFIGATTENPFFEVNKALLSRSRLFRLQPLTSDDLKNLLKRALLDKTRGYGNKNVIVSEEASQHFVDIANGDARILLNALELAVESSQPDHSGLINIDLLIAEESIQERAVLYDKNGDAHFDTISAFIKSLRGSDPDASLFWLARMLEAGENPRFIFRRMLICASEDIGLADPQAIVVVQACAAAFEQIGLPEGIYPLSEAAVYLASTDKSNSLAAFFAAQKLVKAAQAQDVPSHLRDPNRDGGAFGDGIGYLYPHSYKDHWVAQQYMPNQLQGEIFWEPTAQGWEGQRRLQILDNRSAQLSIIQEAEIANPFFLSSGPEDPIITRWLHRQLRQEADRLQKLSENLWSEVILQRNFRILILTSDSLLWALEPLKKVTDGGVTIASPKKYHSRLAPQLDLLDQVDRPDLIDKTSESINNLPNNLQFEWVGGRLYLDDLTISNIDSLWASINQKTYLHSGLRLLITNSIFGPAESLKNLLIDLNEKINDFQFLEKIISLEKTWLSSRPKEDYLVNKLKELGWRVEIKKWTEDLYLDIDKGLEARWLGEGMLYKSLLDNNISNQAIEKIRHLLRRLSGKRLSQRLSHSKILAEKIL